MNAAILQDASSSDQDFVLAAASGKVISAREFRELLISHRRMVRFDRQVDHLRGLRDLDTGEIFLTDERRLLLPR
jgi:hypothetical protein